MVMNTHHVPTAAEIDALDPADRLFTHTRRPKWGVGLWVREDRTRRAFRFQDGELRLFKLGYYHLLQPADVEDPDQMFQELADEEEQARKDKALQEARKELPPVMSFEEQTQVLLHLHDEGFTGDSWIHSLRVPAPEKRSATKSHAEAASKLAKKKLAKDTLMDLAQTHEWTRIHTRACKVLRRTSLVSLSRDVRPFEQVEEQYHQPIARALIDLLHGEGRALNRFASWVDTLRQSGIDASWALATVFQALVKPDKHLFVKHRAVNLQARSILPGTRLRKRPTKRGYRKARRVARATRRHLDKTQDPRLVPADMLDVAQFMWQTLRPKAQNIADDLDD